MYLAAVGHTHSSITGHLYRLYEHRGADGTPYALFIFIFFFSPTCSRLIVLNCFLFPPAAAAPPRTTLMSEANLIPGDVLRENEIKTNENHEAVK